MKQVELQLQINDVYQPVELDEKTSFSMTFKHSDLTNPTAVKIPFSNQISLPKTKLNNQIFACMGIRSTADIINPLIPINFRLYINGSIFQSGYIEIESIDIEDKGFYRIRLYGGLGGFFNYLDNIPLDTLQLDYTHKLTAEKVHDLMVNDNGQYGYAITYQGKYDKFDDGQIEYQSGIQEATWRSGTTTYGNPDLDENRRNELFFSGEYRSYYQKPTLKLRPIFEAIINKAKDDGYEIELDEKFFDDTNPYYNDLWMLCDNYEVGDMAGGHAFTVTEFGDDKSNASNNEVEIETNSAVNWLGSPIESPRFISENGDIDCPVAISDSILLHDGDTITINLATQMIATWYDNSSNDQRFRYKKGSLFCGIEIIDTDNNGAIILKSTPVNTGADDPVPSRSFNDTNVERKRPSNRGSKFGEKNFIYDTKPNEIPDPENTLDGGTKWLYKQSWQNNTGSDKNIMIIFHVTNNTYWGVNGGHKDRKYGVAFKILDGSSLIVSGQTNPESGRTGSEKTFADMIGSEYSCYDLLLSYCKVFGLLFKVDPIVGTIKMLLRDTFYADQKNIDWTNKVDRSKDFSLEPLAFKFQRGVFKYNSLDTKYEEEYRKSTSTSNESEGKEYGSFTVKTGYQLTEEEFNYLEGIMFDNCVVATDYSQYYAGRSSIALRDNKQLPHLQSADGGKVELSGYVLLFRDPANQQLNRSVAVTDDTDVMRAQGTICWNSFLLSETMVLNTVIPKYVRTFEMNGEVYSLNFGVPSTVYSDSETLLDENKNACIYARYWRAYIDDRLDANCKMLTCNVLLTPSDLSGDLLSKFIYLDQTVWVIDEISGFNPLSPAPTKVKLVKVKDIDNYLHHDNNSEEFKILYGGETIYDNLSGGSPTTIILNDNVTYLTFEISSSVIWQATSNVNIVPDRGDPGEIQMTVTIPVEQVNSQVVFNYGNNKVTIRIQRKKLFDVTASANNGTATINGLPSPQQIESGKNATFNATGTTDFLYWEINGTQYANQITTIPITQDTNAVAYFAGTGQIKLYSEDQYTTVSGVQKTGNFWLLNVGQSYTFSNSQANFSGFLFAGESEFRPAGTKTITQDMTSLGVYYDQVLLNITVVNNSTTDNFTGDQISIGGTTLDFEVLPGTTEQITQNVDIDSDVEFDKLPYHYPIFSTNSFPTAGVFNLTITGYPVGWPGDVEETVNSTPVTRQVYGPTGIAWRISAVNATVTPTSGSGNRNITITLKGGDATIVQVIGDVTYNLKLFNDLTISPVAGTYWGQTPDVNGNVQGDMVNVDGMTPSLDDIYSIGTPSRRYTQIYVNDVIGTPLYLQTPGGNALSEIRGAGADGVWNVRSKMYVGSASNSQAVAELAGYSFYSDLIKCFSLTQTSDATKKNIIEKVGTVDLYNISAYRYTFKNDEDNIQRIGLIAQDVKAVLPEAVSGEDGNLGIDYSVITAILVDKVNELEKRIQELENK